MDMSHNNNFPFVSVVIPCRNEEKYILKCLDSLISQNYPKDRLEVLVINGMSEDRTGKIVGEYVEKYHYIRMINNLRKITPCAFNLGIKNAKGEIIALMSAHATYAPDYIAKCVEYLNRYQVDNVGGTMMTLPKDNNLVGKAIVNVLTSRFGVGNSDFRVGVESPKYTDTVFGGCYRKAIFEKIGYFNEQLERSQDMELNLRLKKSGGKIFLAPDIKSYYFTRSDLISFCKNNFSNGFWAIYPLKFTRHIPVSLRHFIPLIFICSLLGSLVLSFFIHPFIWIFMLVVILYFWASIYFSYKIARREKDLRYFFTEPLLFLTLHLIYGVGSILAVANLFLPVRKKGHI